MWNIPHFTRCWMRPFFMRSPSASKGSLKSDGLIYLVIKTVTNHIVLKPWLIRNQCTAYQTSNDRIEIRIYLLKSIVQKGHNNSKSALELHLTQTHQYLNHLDFFALRIVSMLRLSNSDCCKWIYQTPFLDVDFLFDSLFPVSNMIVCYQGPVMLSSYFSLNELSNLWISKSISPWQA